MKIVKCLSNNELNKILDKPYMTAKEISQVCCCGRNKSYEIFNQIKSNYVNKYLPSGMIPTKDLKEYINI